MEIGKLPRVCYFCGSTSAMNTELSLPYTPTARRVFVAPKDPHEVIMVGHAGGFFAPLLPFVMMRHLLVTRRLSLQLPLCEKHCQTATLYHPLMRRIAFVLAFPGTAFSMLACLSFSGAIRGGVNPMEQFGVYWIHAGIGFACIIAALLIRARLHDGFLYLVSVNDDAVVLGGVPANLAETIEMAKAHSGAL